MAEEYILTCDIAYYPWIEYYNSEEDARKAFDNYTQALKDTGVWTISKVISMKTIKEE